MKKYTTIFFISIIGITFAQQTEQFYTIQLVNKGTQLGPDFVGYLDPKFNSICGAKALIEFELTRLPISTIDVIEGQLCAVMKTTVPPKEEMIAPSYYKIIQAQHGSFIPNLVGWMADNNSCNLPPDIDLAGRPGCAVVLANPFEKSENNEND